VLFRSRPQNTPPRSWSYFPALLIDLLAEMDGVMLRRVQLLFFGSRDSGKRRDSRKHLRGSVRGGSCGAWSFAEDRIARKVVVQASWRTLSRSGGEKELEAPHPVLHGVLVRLAVLPLAGARGHGWTQLLSSRVKQSDASCGYFCHCIVLLLCIFSVLLLCSTESGVSIGWRSEEC
jgi:hypothetical protein